MRANHSDQKNLKRPVFDQKTMLNRKEIDRNTQKNKKEYK